MNLLLHVPPDTEARLHGAGTRRQGKDAEALTLEALREKLSIDEASPMLPLDEWHARFDALMASIPPGQSQRGLQPGEHLRRPR